MKSPLKESEISFNGVFFRFCMNLLFFACTETKSMIFTKKKYLILMLILGLLILGFVLMSGGGSSDPNVFNPEIFSFRRITLAPLIIIGSYSALIWLIFKKSVN